MIENKRGPKGPRGRGTKNDHKKLAMFMKVYSETRDDYVPAADVFMTMNREGKRITLAQSYNLDKNINRKYFVRYGLIETIKKDGKNHVKWIGAKPTEELVDEVSIKHYDHTAEDKKQKELEVNEITPEPQMEIPLVVEEPKKEEPIKKVISHEDYKDKIIILQTEMVETLKEIKIEMLKNNISLEGLVNIHRETKNEIHEFVKWGNKLKEPNDEH